MITFILGLLCAGASCGFLVGASSTPVLAGALPIVGGVLTAAIAIYQNKSLSDTVNALKGLDAEAQRTISEHLVAQHRTDYPKVGLGLTVFFISLIVGVIVGSMSRNGEWMRPQESDLYPAWRHLDATRQNRAEAMEAVKAYRELREGGMEHEAALEMLSFPADRAGEFKPLWKPEAPGAKTIAGNLELLRVQKLLEETGMASYDISRVLALEPGLAAPAIEQMEAQAPVKKPPASAAATQTPPAQGAPGASPSTGGGGSGGGGHSTIQHDP